jgi:cysteine-rich repeat protein
MERSSSSESTWYPAASSSSDFFASSSIDYFPYSVASSSSEEFSSFSNVPVCSNGILEDGEQCDRTYPCPEGMFCDVNCQCGTLVVQSPLSSSVSPCGNGTIDQAEQCDDGNSASGDGCTSCIRDKGWDCAGQPSRCQTVCGDFIVAMAEECDDGNLIGWDGCSATCTVEYAAAPSSVPSFISSRPVFPVCGNGIIEADEQCDDGDTDSDDGCSATCLIEKATSSSSVSSSSAPSLIPSSSSISSAIPMPVAETPTRSPWMLWGLLGIIVFVVGFAVTIFLKKLREAKGE